MRRTATAAGVRISNQTGLRKPNQRGEVMNSYNIKFAIDDEGTTGPYVRTYKATNAGQAFQKCLKECPKARPIEAWREGRYLDGYGITTYRPPSMVKVEVAEPAPKAEETKFPFYDECLGKRRPFSG